jgi:hypothetical protein
MVINWLEKGQAFFMVDGKESPIMNLTIGQKRNLLKGLCSLSTVQQDAKMSLLQQTIGDDKSDESMDTRIFCLAAMPDAESKKQAWIKIHNKEGNKMSQKEVEQLIMGFSQTDQPKITQVYSNDYFASLHDMFKTSSFHLFKSYLHGLMPRRGEITDDMIKKLQAYLSTAPQG